jgi:hypothetical protein
MLKPSITGDQITFLDQRFYYVGGQFVPSVTTILEAYPKDAAYLKWLKEVGSDADTIRDAAGERGSNVHHMTEMLDNGLEVSLLDADNAQQWSLQEWAMLARYVDFRQRFPIDIEAIEMQLVSTNLGFAGTVDRLIVMNGKRYIIDIKTSNAIYESYWLQVAAYQKLFDELGEHIDGVGILWLNAKTRTNGSKGAIQGEGWQLLLKEDTAQDWELFLHTKALWEAKNKGVKPKNITYKLKQKL